MKRIRIGTRGSKLALRQAEMVQEAIQQKDSGIETQIVVLHTKGDKILDKPLSEIGDKGVFVSEFEQALLTGEIDLAVHSGKDLPMTLADGLVIAAVLPRGDARDVLVVLKGGRVPWAMGDDSFVIGTGSRRRRQQAVRLWENVSCENIRGNIDTRLQKLKSSRAAADRDRNISHDAEYKPENAEMGNHNALNYDGLILAQAGLDRLEIISRYKNEFEFWPLAPEQFLPAACQGIIAVETRRDSETALLCREVTDADTEFSFLVEREVLAQLAADCSDAAAAWCRQEQGKVILDVMYAGNRQQVVREAKAADRTEQIQTGLAMAKEAAGLVKEKGRS